MSVARAGMLGVAAVAGALALQGLASAETSADCQPRRPQTATRAAQTTEASLRYEYDELERRLAHSGIRVRDPALDAYVREIGCGLADAACENLRFYILEDPSFNASVAPNGMVLVNSGLLLRLQSDAELAFVLGHEIGHYKGNHILERVVATKNAMAGGAVLTIGLAALGAGALAELGYVGTLAGVLSFSRDQESEADTIGVDLMRAHGYDTASAVLAMRRLSDEDAASSNTRRRREARRSSLFDTHPMTSDRIAALEKQAGAASETAPDKAAYRAHIRPHLSRWLEAEVANRDFGATLHLVDRLSALGADIGPLEHARGEVYRIRGDAGDGELARTAYAKATESEDAPAVSWRQLGVVEQKLGHHDPAVAAFRTYLARAPEATDAALVRSMIGEGQ